jgi:glutamine amidotransferase
MLAIIDYGTGNLSSLRNALAFIGFESRLIRTPEEILRADKLILPGVGAFGYAMDHLRRPGLVEPIREAARKGTPLMGICLGMQLFLTRSYEAGEHKGLDLVSGIVRKLDVQLKVPHIGWNEINVTSSSRLFKNLPKTRYGYFVHSYYCELTEESEVSATTDYQIEFTSALEKDNLFATQFHPEKSQELGLQILKNFAEL